MQAPIRRALRVRCGRFANVSLQFCPGGTRRSHSDCSRKNRVLFVMGRITVKIVPLVVTIFVTGDHTTAGDRFVATISFEAAPLNGHCSLRFWATVDALMINGAPMPPMASAPGRTFPVE